MDAETINQIFEYQIGKVESTLVKKGDEYATEDRLHNFRVAATMQGASLKQALAGMMAKHTASVYDMCSSDEEFDLDKWDEKITDHINYLFLLAAVVRDGLENRPAPAPIEVTSIGSMQEALDMFNKAPM